MTLRALPARADALRLLRERFFNRTDLVAILAPWGKPCPVDANGVLDQLLLGHMFGAAVPAAKVRYTNRRSSGAMSGHFRVGSYAPGAGDTTRWLCLDLDGPGHAHALADPAGTALATADAFAEAGLPCYLERSGGGTGWHVWCFFDAPVAASTAQALGRALAPKNAPLAGDGGQVADPRLARGIEVFPKQSKIRKAGFGNAVWLPWWHGAVEGANGFYRRTEDGALEAYAPTELETASLEAVDRVLATQPASVPRTRTRLGDAPRTPREPRASVPSGDAAGASVWGAWRKKALEALPLEAVYGDWLTGKPSGNGWLECRDPASPSGDSTPSAGVADGTGEAERGTFHSFIDARTLSVFDFLVAHAGVVDFRAARARVAELVGVPEPPALPETGAGSAAAPSSGAIAAPSSGTAAAPSSGTAAAPGSSASSPPGAGASSPPGTGASSPPSSRRGQPVIQVNDRLLRHILADAWEAVHAANRREPTVFFRDGGMVRVGWGAHGRRLEPLTEVSVHAHLGEVATWVRVTKQEAVHCVPSKDAARAMFDQPSHLLPFLNSVVTTPFFTAAGTLIATPGYNAEAQVWYEPAPELALPPVPAQPTAAAVDQARALFLEELLGDFPFVNDAARAHMVAAMLLPFVRQLVRGATPIHLFEAPTEGSGKGLLVDLVAILATGAPACGGSLPESEDELRKKLGSELSTGRPIVFLDNGDNKRRLDSAALASVTTMWPVWTDRLLGQIKMFYAPNEVVWILTANNPRLSRELSRRCVRIRIDSGVDRPWLRTGFRHPQLLRWAQAHRAELVHAALVLIQHWVACGRPVGAASMGRFEEWSEVIGGILLCAQIDGFLGNVAAVYDPTDAEGTMWSEFVAAWWEAHQDQPTRVSDLVQLCLAGEFMTPVLGEHNERSQSTRLGLALQNARDRVFVGRRIEFAGRDPDSKRPTYRLVEAEQKQTNPSDPVPTEKANVQKS